MTAAVPIRHNILPSLPAVSEMLTPCLTLEQKPRTFRIESDAREVCAAINLELLLCSNTIILLPAREGCRQSPHCRSSLMAKRLNFDTKNTSLKRSRPKATHRLMHLRCSIKGLDAGRVGIVAHNTQSNCPHIPLFSACHHTVWKPFGPLCQQRGVFERA